MLKLKLLVKNLIMKSLSKILVKIFFKTYSRDNFYFILWEIDRYAREQIEHNIDKLSGEQIAAFLLARDKLHKLIEDYGVGFYHVE